MASIPETKPVEDSVAKIDNDFAVGSDLDFQNKWERFERLVWIVLIAFIILSFAGFFGRGPVAHAKAHAVDGSMNIEYERVQRFGTPSVMTIGFPPSSVQNGALMLWASDCLVKPLGTQRVIPQPERSVPGRGCILYTFSAGKPPLSVEFQTQPGELGLSELELQVPGKALTKVGIFVVP